jgi:glutathione S-transferase
VNATLPHLLTVHDVALWLSMPPGRVLRLVRAGQIPHLVLPDGEPMFEAAALAQWADTLRFERKGGPDAA